MTGLAHGAPGTPGWHVEHWESLGWHVEHWERQTGMWSIGNHQAGTWSTGNAGLAHGAPPGAGSRRAGLAQQLGSLQGRLAGAGAGVPIRGRADGARAGLPALRRIPPPPASWGSENPPAGPAAACGTIAALPMVAPLPPAAAGPPGAGLGDFFLYVLCINKQNAPNPPKLRVALTPGVAGPQGGVPPGPDPSSP